MPRCFKLYQKNNCSGENSLSGKVFFRKPMTLPHLKSLRITGPSVQDIHSGTDARKAGVLSPPSPLDARFFLFKSMQRVGLRRSATRALHRGSRQGRGFGSCPLHSFMILALALLFFLAGCQTESKKKPLSDIEAMRIRQQVLFEFYVAWQLERDEREFLNIEKGIEDGTENIHNKKSGPGSGTRKGSVQSQGTAEGLANQHRGKGERRSGAVVETEQSETTQEIEKTEEIEKENLMGESKTRQSESERVRLWLKEEKESEVI